MAIEIGPCFHIVAEEACLRAAALSFCMHLINDKQSIFEKSWFTTATIWSQLTCKIVDHD